MRVAGRILVRVLDAMAAAVAPGVTTRELDRICESGIKAEGAEPTFKGYCGYPAAACVSVNDEVVHGIPGDRRLKSGDLVKIDVGVTKAGLIADAARTFCYTALSFNTYSLSR